MEVPTAPSTQDFTKIQYTYNDGAINEAIENMTKISDSTTEYNYLVEHYHYADIFTGVRVNKVNPQVRIDEDGNYYVGSNQLTLYNEADAEERLKLSLAKIKEDNPDDVIASTTGNIYYFNSFGRYYFVTEEELLASSQSAPDPTNPIELQANLNTYYADDIRTKLSRTDKAFIEFDNEGRAQSITFENISATFAINTETLTDDAAYQDAMNQYEYKKTLYEKAVQDINAKTEIIQKEDRTLELRLKQLDTEQNALTTEMEAVAAVIKKNVESTFSTFKN